MQGLFLVLVFVLNKYGLDLSDYFGRTLDNAGDLLDRAVLSLHADIYHVNASVSADNKETYRSDGKTGSAASAEAASSSYSSLNDE